MHHVGTVTQHLDLDMPGALDIAFHIESVVAESRMRLRHSLRHQILQRGLVLHDPDAAAAAAGTRLDHDRIADAARLLSGVVEMTDPTLAARDHWHTGRDRFRARHGFVAHLADRIGVGSYEDDAGRL